MRAANPFPGLGVETEGLSIGKWQKGYRSELDRLQLLFFEHLKYARP